MTKRMAIWLVVTMSLMFLFIFTAAAFGAHPGWWSDGPVVFGLLGALCFVLLMAGTVGALVVGTLLNAYVRRTGTPLVGAVVHARPAGYVNHVPNWELELALADGRTGRMQATRFSDFSRGERLDVIAGKGNPARTVLPAISYQRTSF